VHTTSATDALVEIDADVVVYSAIVFISVCCRRFHSATVIAEASWTDANTLVAFDAFFFIDFDDVGEVLHLGLRK